MCRHSVVSLLVSLAPTRQLSVGFWFPVLSQQCYLCFPCYLTAHPVPPYSLSLAPTPSGPFAGQLRGLVMLQNLPSIVAASVLDPPPGSRVLDMCAAPGGKTTMLAQIMQGRGQVCAVCA